MRSGKGGSEKGPNILPNLTSLANFSCINCGSIWAVGKFLGALNLKLP